MRFLDRLRRKKEEAAPPVAEEAPETFDDFARQASQSAASITIEMSAVARLVNALGQALMREYPYLRSEEAYGHAHSGLSLACAKCGPMSREAVSLLFLAASGALQGATFGGANVAALARGRCPLCGGTAAIATFDPQAIQAQLEAARAETAAAAEISPLEWVCSAEPFFDQLVVSPDENLVCCVAPDGVVVAYQAGTNRQQWALPLASRRGCLCSFVGPERLVVISPLGEDRMLWQLLNAVDGTVIAELPGPAVVNCAADLGSGVLFGLHPWRLEIVQTAGDQLTRSTVKPGQQLDLGPWVGPDGRCYVLSLSNLCYMDGEQLTTVMPGDHCVCFDSPATVYAGGGFYDRSGASFLNSADLSSGLTSQIPWGREPVHEIALAGPGRLLLGSHVIPTMGRSYPAQVSLFSLAGQEKVWSETLSGLAPVRKTILASVPEEGWAVIETGVLLKVIALEDARVLRILAKGRDEVVTARWLARKKLLYLARNTNADQPGVLECFRM